MPRHGRRRTRAVMLLLLVVMTLLVPTTALAGGASPDQSATYVIGPVTLCGSKTVPVNLAAACIDVPTGYQTASVRIDDAVFGGVLGAYTVQDAFHRAIATGHFCGTVTLSVPAEARSIRVDVTGNLDPTDNECVVGGPTEGVITARFS